MSSTLRQRVIQAQDKAEEAMSDLINAAQQWEIPDRQLWTMRNDRTRLLKAARFYARAMDRVSRVRK